MKNKGILIIILLSFFLYQCSFNQDKENNTPAHLISKDKMIVILADIQITEAYLKNLKKMGHKVTDTSILYYKRVFKKNSVTRSDFEENLLYYKQDLKGLEDLYTQVITRLNELQAKNEELLLQMKADSIKQDSLKHAALLLDSIQQLYDSSEYVQQQ